MHFKLILLVVTRANFFRFISLGIVRVMIVVIHCHQYSCIEVSQLISFWDTISGSCQIMESIVGPVGTNINKSCFVL